MPLNCGAREDSWESCKEIKPVNPKGNQPWTFIGKTDAEAEASIFWPPDTKSQLTGKDIDAGKDWRQKETRVAELNGHESQQILGDSEGQGSLVCCSSRGGQELDMT